LLQERKKQLLLTEGANNYLYRPVLLFNKGY